MPFRNNIEIKRVYNSAGEVKFPEFEVDTPKLNFTTSQAISSKVAMDCSGDFVIVWNE